MIDKNETYQYYHIDTKKLGKRSFKTVKDAKVFIQQHWPEISEGHSDRYVVSVTRNLLHYGSYTMVGHKLVRCD